MMNVYGGHQGGEYASGYGAAQYPYVQSQKRSAGRRAYGRPQDCLYFAVFAFLCCCPFLGFIAVIFSHKSRFDYIEGDEHTADYNGKVSMYLSILSMFIGVALIVLLMLFVFAPWIFFGEGWSWCIYYSFC